MSCQPQTRFVAGRLMLNGRARAIFDSLDQRFAAMAAAAGARMIHAPPFIAHDALDRAGYYEAFGEGATRVPGLPPGDDRRHPPAMCYHVYALLAAQRLVEPVRLTIAGSCYRHEPSSSPSPWRLSEFTMREIIFVGPADWVAREREAWMTRIASFASSIGLRAVLEIATDSFFAGDTGRGRRLMQQMKELKYELRVDGDDGPTAIASFNLHETFFGSRFNVTMADDETVSSGCVAFGLERWTLALMASGQHQCNRPTAH